MPISAMFEPWIVAMPQGVNGDDINVSTHQCRDIDEGINVTGFDFFYAISRSHCETPKMHRSAGDEYALHTRTLQVCKHDI